MAGTNGKACDHCHEHHGRRYRCDDCNRMLCCWCTDRADGGARGEARVYYCAPNRMLPKHHALTACVELCKAMPCATKVSSRDSPTTIERY